jgi:hypothetical protein
MEQEGIDSDRTTDSHNDSDRTVTLITEMIKIATIAKVPDLQSGADPLPRAGICCTTLQWMPYF